ncbi:unnamed protein product [Sphenostylis stenocarpa]|uniref:Uncharacterized protein n=1 Tax=Sphenostylis stenocarpa TaxID=92480 RepID=A0AA86SJA4_9FABA|nr:unnamed protein product [Sphenostylis stenocarpa]
MKARGQRAKLACANWAGHLQPMIPEGLDKRPLKDIIGEIVEHKFSVCVSPTQSTCGHVMSTTMSMPRLPLWMYQNVKVLLDNHVSEPKWCCNDDDENGFFHDRHFNPQEWVYGLTRQPNTLMETMLYSKPLKIDLGKKMVFETHLYSWSGIGTPKLREIWTKQPSE